MEEIINDYQKIIEDNKAGKNICFIDRGEWANPDIAYKGLLVSQMDVEAYLNDQCRDTPSYKDWETAIEELFEDYNMLGLIKGLDEFKISDVMSASVLKK